MIQFTTTMLKFGEQGDKTGWTYIVVPAQLAQQLKPGNKKSFRVKGRLDQQSVSGMSLLPMGEGDFMLALNGPLRKRLLKQAGASLVVRLEIDQHVLKPSPAFMDCLKDEPAALAFFRKLPMSHQHYFIKWIDSAKADLTKTQRIARSVNALARGMGYGEMLRMTSAPG